MAAFLIFSGAGNPIQQAMKYLIFAGFCGGLMILALDASPRALLPRLFCARPLRFMGKISYAMYVFHPWICGWLWKISTRPNWSPLKHHLLLANLIDFSLVLGTTVLVAWLSWIVFESRILRLKNRFEYQAAEFD
jgi:peptidoglycan/LPS O-acetylase OafA/YrhL